MITLDRQMIDRRRNYQQASSRADLI